MPTLRLFWDAAAAIEPGAFIGRDATLLRAMTQPGELRAALTRAGFVHVIETMPNARVAGGHPAGPVGHPVAIRSRTGPDRAIRQFRLPVRPDELV